MGALALWTGGRLGAFIPRCSLHAALSSSAMRDGCHDCQTAVALVQLVSGPEGLRMHLEFWIIDSRSRLIRSMMRRSWVIHTQVRIILYSKLFSETLLFRILVGRYGFTGVPPKSSIVRLHRPTALGISGDMFCRLDRPTGKPRKEGGPVYQFRLAINGESSSSDCAALHPRRASRIPVRARRCKPGCGRSLARC